MGLQRLISICVLGVAGICALSGLTNMAILGIIIVMLNFTLTPE